MPPAQQHQPTAAHQPHGKRRGMDWNGRAVRIEWFVFTSMVAVILLLVIGWLIFDSNGKSESDRVNTDRYQAVFLNGGVTSGSVAYSTYFGHITKLTNNYMVLNNVYYLTDQSTTSGSASSPQLVKLGCQQLHSPYDEMVINRPQVAFWENLQNNGKVVQAIQAYIKQNPNGPNCSQTNSSSSSTPSTATPQSTSGTGTGTSNTTSSSGQ